MDNFLLFMGSLSLGIGIYLKVEHNIKHPSKITPKIAKNFIKCKAKVIDVRTDFEYKAGTVVRENDKGVYENIAINIEGKDITEENLIKKEINKDDIIITFCNSGTRARQAADKITSFGYKNVFYIVETYLSLND